MKASIRNSLRNVLFHPSPKIIPGAEYRYHAETVIDINIIIIGKK